MSTQSDFKEGSTAVLKKEKNKNWQLRMHPETMEALRKEADARGVEASTLARFYIEKALGIIEPGIHTDNWARLSLDPEYRAATGLARPGEPGWDYY